MLQIIKSNKLLLAALILVSAATFNSPKVDARNSQNLNLTQLPTSSANCDACNTEGIASEWKEFSPDEGKSSILMPNGDISDMTPDKSEMDENVESVKMYLSIDGTDVYMVSYADFNNDVTQIPSSELLDSALQGMLEDGKKLLSQQNITLGAYPGREIKLWDEKEGIFMTGRVFIVNQRLYILFVGSDKNPQVSDVRKFFDSFELMQ
ncbi:hypothetical protein LC605_16990 [Nostoc sp. CHAB 5836]|uniref:hypothetical protein n=1 Tax=Nostoc sp. CHAB 5836 TaxID=2780404 RepID=UPI001E3C692D|nr:hypothetical protein [Nostoc sp. CHAB 5836]MCC5616738.1 hypothetical protein [Nostoc sp. CHAB 5836]